MIEVRIGLLRTHGGREATKLAEGGDIITECRQEYQGLIAEEMFFDGRCPMNSAFQDCPDVFKRKKSLTSFPTAGRAATFLRAAITFILALSLIYGCAKESEDLAKLRKENRALKEKIASLESKIKPELASKPEINEELLDLARKLKASPKDFVGQQIKLHCRFGGFEIRFLNDTNGPKFLSTYYIGFIAQSGKDIDEPIFDHLFISKKEAREQGVYRLGINDLVTIYGIVNSAYNKEPWIEVYVIKKGWG